MNFKPLFFSALCVTTMHTTLISQDIIYDEISMGAGYENMLFYSLEDGLVGEAPMAGWDLSFDVRPMGSTANINCGLGHTLYPFGSLDDWDTASLENWEIPSPYRNDHSNWSVGAFNQGNDPNDGFDLGWGIYDIVTHVVTADHMYVLQLPSGDYKKLAILSLSSGIYTLRHANMDGSEEFEIEINKDDFEGKLHAYINIENNEVLDYEPDANWDLLAMRYLGDIGDGVLYGVTGILMNYGVLTQQMDGLADPFVDGEYDEALLTDDINAIGSDWKSYSMTAGYSVVEDRCYAVSDMNGNIWRVVFTSFDGSSTGNMEIGKVPETPSSSVHEPADFALEYYPNPVVNHGDLRVVLPNANGGDVRIISLTGATVKTHRMTSNIANINLGGIKAGLYLLECRVGNQVAMEKLLIQ